MFGVPQTKNKMMKSQILRKREVRSEDRGRTEIENEDDGAKERKKKPEANK